jgi:hypothetical protein
MELPIPVRGARRSKQRPRPAHLTSTLSCARPWRGRRWAHLTLKSKTEYTGLEDYVADKVATEDLSFMPRMRAIVLTQQDSAAKTPAPPGGGASGSVESTVTALERKVDMLLRALANAGGGGGGASGAANGGMGVGGDATSAAAVGAQA